MDMSGHEQVQAGTNDKDEHKQAHRVRARHSHCQKYNSMNYE